ncbi:hypothetical protein BGZ54_000117 [Gamsiella multidivaricata]|nr:hypothetical protein BGZ54_000117 [Gamsiella multidivaricata]
MTYLFFGCLVASRIPFNLYGGIIVVCMGLAFFMLSYVKLIPPLDGLILNYKKLDQWKEQKHFRVQLEAQRIFEQQLQQEQNLTRMIPMHHSNALTVHAHMAVGSPKQIRAFSAINADSTNASGIGAGVGTGASADAGDLKTMFSPPLSPRKSANYPLGPMQTPHQRSGDPDPMFPHHQPQSKRCESTANLETSDQQPRVPANQTCPSNEQGHSPYPDALSDGQMQLDKALPPIMVSEREGHLAFTHHGTFTLSPPPACRQSAISSEPGSPLQYLNVDDPTDKTPDPTPGDKAELSTEDGIVKSAPHPLDQNSQRQQTPDRQHQRQQRFGQQQFPIRTTNKPAPPHDPFRLNTNRQNHPLTNIQCNSSSIIIIMFRPSTTQHCGLQKA